MIIQTVSIIFLLLVVGCQSIDIPKVEDGAFLKINPPSSKLVASGRILEVHPVSVESGPKRSKVIFRHDIGGETVEHIVYALDEAKRNEVIGQRAAYSFSVPINSTIKDISFRKLISPFDVRFEMIRESVPPFYHDPRGLIPERTGIKGRIVSADLRKGRPGETLLRIEFEPLQSKKSYTIYTNSVEPERVRKIVGAIFLFDSASSQRENLSKIFGGKINYIYDFDYHFIETH